MGPVSQEHECCEESKARTGTEMGVGGGEGGQLARAKSMKNCIGLHSCRSKLRVGRGFFWQRLENFVTILIEGSI